MSRPHINADGEFQSDKYPTCPPGKVPLSVKDKTAQPLLYRYAQIRRAVDAEFADDLEYALKQAGFFIHEGLSKTLLEFYDALEGKGRLAADWKDKPHRLIYDLLLHVTYWRDLAFGALDAYENNVRADTLKAAAQEEAAKGLSAAMFRIRGARVDEGRLPGRNPNIPRFCRACFQPLRMENLFCDDGCPCNSPRGVNFLPVKCLVCKESACVKPGHRLQALFGNELEMAPPRADAWKDGDDKPLPEDKEIEATFPTRSHRHDLYTEAVRMVGARFSKYGLVGVVNMLLHRADKGKKLAAKVRAYIDAEDQDRVTEFDEMEEVLKEVEGAVSR